LRSKLNVDEWDKVLRSELWDLPIEETCILPSLRLSYTYLSSYLKCCFAYCFIFPKGYTFKKDKLVLLWMADGLLPQPKNKTMEEVGEDYFHSLVKLEARLAIFRILGKTLILRSLRPFKGVRRGYALS
jgi:hypothetical protein